MGVPRFWLFLAALILVFLVMQAVILNSRVKVCSYPGYYYNTGPSVPYQCGHTWDFKKGRARFTCVLWLVGR